MRQIGKYEILGLLGQGGMGTVYKVLLPVAEKVVALKLLRPNDLLVSILGQKRVEQLFQKEAKALGQIRHPNVADVLDFDYDQQGRAFFVQEYFCMNLGLLIGEQDILEHPTRSLLPVRAVDFARQTLLGLSRLHQAGIVHRDIKPANLLLSDDEQVKIIDFGLSRFQEEDGKTPSNLKVGSPYYAAPEQERDPDNVDIRADLYSVGITLWRLLTGNLPNRAQDGLSSTGNMVLDEEWEEYLLQATAFDPDERFQTADEMLLKLDELYRRWQQRMDRVCVLSEAEDGQSLENSSSEEELRKIRAQPVWVRKREAGEFFELDSLWRPNSYGQSEYKSLDKTVWDKKTARLWQKSGSAFALTWQEALSYVQQLNEQRYAGQDNWRLPTVEELFSILRPYDPERAVCLNPVFDPEKRCLWSCDQASSKKAWIVDTELGFVDFQDETCRFFVRAVSCG